MISSSRSVHYIQPSFGVSNTNTSSCTSSCFEANIFTTKEEIRACPSSRLSQLHRGRGTQGMYFEDEEDDDDRLIAVMKASHVVRLTAETDRCANRLDRGVKPDLLVKRMDHDDEFHDKTNKSFYLKSEQRPGKKLVDRTFNLRNTAAIQWMEEYQEFVLPTLEQRPFDDAWATKKYLQHVKLVAFVAEQIVKYRKKESEEINVKPILEDLYYNKSGHHAVIVWKRTAKQLTR